jgi:adenosylcobinamide-phosphate synthase
VAGFGRLAAAAERRTWRPSRLAGAAYVAALVGTATALAAVAERVLEGRRGAQFLVRAAGVWITLGGRSLERAAIALDGHVAAGELEAARALAPTLVGRDPARLDGPELCRAAVESVAENTSDAVVAPLLWAAVRGLPGVVGYRAANTLDAMVGHRGERYGRFGWAAARLDDVLNWPAARLTALIVIAATPLVGGRPQDAWRAAFIDGAAHPSPNAGLVEGAFAGALALRLGGLNRYSHGVERRPDLGGGAAPGAGDVARAVGLSRVVSAAAAALAALLAWGRCR